jgi:putative endonuclease
MSILKRFRGVNDGEETRILGRRGERLAVRHLRRAGFTIEKRNLTIGKDEADIIAIDPEGGALVVVEVKTRRGEFLSPEDAITPHKQRCLVRLASNLTTWRRYADMPVRFDVIAIHWPLGGKPEVAHHRGAFDAPY